MPVLTNPRHELYAQGLASGLTQEQAYIKAGFTPEPGASAQSCASICLSRHEEIKGRVIELQQGYAVATVLDRPSATRMLLEDRETARSLGQMGPAVAATMGAAKVNGLIVDKSLNINADIEDVPLSRLRELDSLLTGSPSVPMIDVTPQGSAVVSEAAIDASDSHKPD